MSKSSFLKGTAILTFTMLLSKVLGFIYVIPFTRLVGTQGYILFEYAYKPYVIMLSISTLGLPAAVSKFVSKYNELGDYETGRKLFKSGLIILSLTGVLWAALLYISAPTVAEWLVGKKHTTGNSMADVAYVIKMVSFALIIVPPMALWRGYFQGFQKMNPTAISQVVEQFVRVLLIVGTSFYVMHYGTKAIKDAVGQATFTAFTAAIISTIVLIYYWYKYKNEMLVKNTAKGLQTPTLFSMYKELFISSVPFVIVSLAIPIYQNIDIFTINPALTGKGLPLDKAEYVNSIVALTQKITILPTILANAFALTLVPAITKSYIGNRTEELKSQITKTFQITFFFTLPCAIFFLVFGKETFGVLLGTRYAVYGGNVTSAYSWTAILFSFFMVTSAILQGINKQGFAVISMLCGITVKCILAIPFIDWLSGSGTAYSTFIGFIISLIMNFIVIKKYTKFEITSLVKQSMYVIGLSAVTGLALYATKWILTKSIHLHMSSQYIESFIIVAIAGVVALIIYCGLSYYSGLLGEFLGSKFKKKING